MKKHYKEGNMYKVYGNRFKRDGTTAARPFLIATFKLECDARNYVDYYRTKNLKGYIWME